MDAQTPFLMNPRYARYELGVAQLDDEIITNWLASNLSPKQVQPRIILFVVMITLLGLLATRDTTTKLERMVFAFEFWIEAVLFCAAAGFIIYVLYRLDPKTREARHNFERLRNSRIVIDGELVSLEWRGHDVVYRDRLWQKVSVSDHMLIANYQFISPTSGQVVLGRIQRDRQDLRYMPLPDLNTPVRVLYVDDQTHLML